MVTQNSVAKLIRWWHTEFGNEIDSLVTYNSSARTDSLVTQNSTTKLIHWWHIEFDTEIDSLVTYNSLAKRICWLHTDFGNETNSLVTYRILQKSSAHNMLLLNQKSLAKTELLSTYKSSMKHISTIDVEIVSAHNLFVCIFLVYIKFYFNLN